MSAFRFIEAEKAHHPISLMCRMLGVSQIGVSRLGGAGAPSDRQLTDAWLLERIRADPLSRTAGCMARRGSTPSCGSSTGSAWGASGWSG